MNDPICHSIEEIWNSNFPNWVSVNEPYNGPGNEVHQLSPQELSNNATAAANVPPPQPWNIYPIGGGVHGRIPKINLGICFRAGGGTVPAFPVPIPKLPKVPKTDTDPKTDPDNKGDKPSNKDNESPSDEHDADPPPPEFRPTPPTPRPAAE